MKRGQLGAGANMLCDGSGARRLWPDEWNSEHEADVLFKFPRANCIVNSKANQRKSYISNI